MRGNENLCPPRDQANNIEGAAVIARVLKLEDLLDCVHEALQVHKALYIFPRFPCETCLTLCSCGNGYLSVLKCASLYLIIRVHIYLLCKAVSFLKREAR